MNRKFLIFAIMIFIIAVGAVSAQDINNDSSISYENQNVSELSTLAVDDVETADILQDPSHARFNIENTTSILYISVLDDDDFYVKEGMIYLSLEDYGTIKYIQLNEYGYSISFDLYEYYDMLPNNLIITYEGENYNVDNLNISVDITDSIIANDVVGESYFSATFLDRNGYPLTNERVSFSVYDNNHLIKYFGILTDDNGVAVVDKPVPIGNYRVLINNYGTGQYKNCRWNITKEDENKISKIVAYQNGSDIVLRAVDKDGNNISYGSFELTSEHAEGSYATLWGGSYLTLSLLKFDINGYPQNITIYFTNDDYYPANATLYVDKVNDTIEAQDVVDGSSFNARFLDTLGNPINKNSVVFSISSQDPYYYNTYYLTTDVNGFASVKPALEVGNYKVWLNNMYTSQSKTFWWNITKRDESKFVDIVAYQNGSAVIVGAVDKEGNNITLGYFTFTSEKGEHDSAGLYGASYAVISLYRFDVSGFPQNMMINFNSGDYYPANATLYVSKLNDTIDAQDVVDSFSFNVTLFDERLNPLTEGYVSFEIDGKNNSYYKYLSPEIDSEGFANVTLTLPVGCYEVKIENLVTSQSKTFWWNITKEDESKKSSINVTRDKYRFTIDVTVADGKIVNDGHIKIYIYEDYNTFFAEVNNGTAIFDYESQYWRLDGERNIIFTFENDNYYPSDATLSFPFNSTINADNSKGTRFNATFTDIDGNLLKGHDVLFTLYDHGTKKFIENITRKTDENGFAYIEKTDSCYEYNVEVINLDTYQHMVYEWINKKEIEISPVAIYDNETDCYITTNETLTFKTSPDATGAVVLEDGIGWRKNITDGEFTIVLPNPRKYTLYGYYVGDRNYSSKTDLLFNVLFYELPVPTMTISENLTGDYGEKVNFTVNLKYGSKIISNASVNIIIGNNTYDMTTDENGNIALPLELDAGKYDVSVNYVGSSDYYSVNKNTTLTINKINPTIDVNKTTIDYGGKLIVNVNDDAEGEITAVINGKNYTASVADGIAAIGLQGLAAGNYTASITYSGDDNYNALTKEVNITVEQDKSDIISAPDVTKYYGGPERFVVTVTDYQGKALANKSVTAVINGVSYDRKTNANGTTSFPLGLNSGVYNVTVTVDNNTVNSVVTILSTVNGTDIVKMYRNGTQYYATFLDGEGKYLTNGTMVIFNINGVMYERKISGNEGLAKLNINLAQGKYIITAINPVTGDNTANNITVLPLFTENRDVTKYYRNGTQYTVKVLGDDGNPVGAGENVTFNINGVFYTRQTDANGTAKLNINLQPGDYIITAQYKGCMVSNNIKVLPILNATDITMSYRDGTQFVANLVDGQGRPYANQKVEFNINGVFYYRSTDSSGQAKLNINLMPGEYIITSSYNGSSIANTVKINA